jgi:hypothetical protein
MKILTHLSKTAENANTTLWLLVVGQANSSGLHMRHHVGQLELDLSAAPAKTHL